MKIAIIGTDPAGLYLACLLKSRDPAHEVRIFDTGAPDRRAATPHILANPVKPEMKLADAVVGASLMKAAARTSGAVVVRDSERIVAPGHSYTLIGAEALVGLLRRRAAELDCAVVSGPLPTSDLDRLGDLVVIADGAQSATRTMLAEDFRPELTTGTTRYMVFRLDGVHPEAMLLFRRTPAGVIHAFLYPDGTGTSVLIVEAPAETISRAGLDHASLQSAAIKCAALFEGVLAGRSLTALGPWRAHVGVRNEAWTSGRCVLIGAAAYNAHHSVGLGVRSGFEDAEALATLVSDGGVEQGLSRFEAARRPRAESMQRASSASLTWYEHARRYVDMPLPQFAYSLLTRSLRINHESMRGLAPDITEAVETTLAGGARTTGNRPPPPMFTPITLRGLTIPNRIVMSPMCMYNAIDKDGTVGDFHLVHYGSRAVGGAGLIITEMTDVSPEGRISAHCAGMYKPEHVTAWRRVTDFIHQKTQAKIGIQLGHAGRKGGEPRPWDRGAPRGPQWPILAPSPIPLIKGGAPPREMTRADMDRLVNAYAAATRMAHDAGFDFLELHFAHGYLLSTFISPLSNKRTDKYGGSLANRLRFPMEVFEAVRAQWPHDKPTCVRISAYDWMEGGTTVDDAIEIGRMLRDAGNDILSVSTGGVAGVRPSAGRLYQATFSDQVRNELKITTMNVGAMASHGDINAMLAAGRADMCALARGHLFDPYFTRHAAYQQDYADLPWPDEYERAASLEMRDF